MRYFVVLSILVQSASIAGADWVHEPVILSIGSTSFMNGEAIAGKRAHYCLFLGSEEARRIDEASEVMTSNLSLLHPVPDVAAKMRIKADQRWFAIYTAGHGNDAVGETMPLLSTEVWESVPAPLRHILAALGVEDSSLILISAHLESGGIYVYFDPRFDQDERFYLQKCSLLERYIQTHDMESALPLEKVSVAPGG